MHNTADVPRGLSRAAALAESLISTHLVIELSDGAFISPLEAGRTSVNIFPVLATPDDRAVLGAGIVLPDHPRISEHSHGNLFDNTEIEEALVLHVQTLTDAERASAAAQDRVVGEMLERALALGPEEIMGLHSGLTDVARSGGVAHPRRLRGPRRAARGARRGPVSSAATRSCCAPAPSAIHSTGCSTAAARRSSGSTSTTTTACTSA